MRAANSSGVTNTYAWASSPGRRSRVVHDRLSHSCGSRGTSRATKVPLPTPPGPEMTMIRVVAPCGSGVARERLEQRDTLLGAQTPDAARLADADLFDRATRLDLADAG